jgi:hypothetical protein
MQAALAANLECVADVVWKRVHGRLLSETNLSPAESFGPRPPLLTTQLYVNSFSPTRCRPITNLLVRKAPVFLLRLTPILRLTPSPGPSHSVAAVPDRAGPVRPLVALLTAGALLDCHDMLSEEVERLLS